MKNVYVVINTSREELKDKAEFGGYKTIKFAGDLIGIAEGVKERKRIIENFMEKREDSYRDYIRVIKMEKEKA